MLRRLRHLLLNWAIRKLVAPVDIHQVLTCEEKIGVLKLGGEQLSDMEVRELKAEVSALTRFKVWAILHETLRQKALEKGFTHSTDFDQVLIGKSMLLSLSIQRMVLEAIERARVKDHVLPPEVREVISQVT